ncbi:MAG: DNA-methyltransferase [Nitrososphaera sp.]
MSQASISLLEESAECAALRSLLGEPSYSQPHVLIFQGDCLDFLKKVPDGIIPLTVTSPPYNIGKPYEQQKDIEEYLNWCESWIREIYRVTAPHGAFWLNLGYLEVPGRARALPLPYLLWNRIPFYIIQEVVWNYGAGVAARRAFSPRNEKFLWCVKDPDNYIFNLDDVRDKAVKYPNQKKNGRLKCNPNGKNPSDVWQIPKVTSGTNRASKERTDHPAQFPIAVVSRIIKACSNPGDLVLDPFMGSGSTAEACLCNSRKVVGFEIRSDYIRVAGKRIENFLQLKAQEDAQQKLFPSIQFD